MDNKLLNSEGCEFETFVEITESVDVWYAILLFNAYELIIFFLINFATNNQHGRKYALQ